MPNSEDFLPKALRLGVERSKEMAWNCQSMRSTADCRGEACLARVPDHPALKRMTWFSTANIRGGGVRARQASPLHSLPWDSSSRSPFDIARPQPTSQQDQ